LKLLDPGLFGAEHELKLNWCVNEAVSLNRCVYRMGCRKKRLQLVAPRMGERKMQGEDVALRDSGFCPNRHRVVAFSETPLTDTDYHVGPRKRLSRKLFELILRSVEHERRLNQIQLVAELEGDVIPGNGCSCVDPVEGVRASSHVLDGTSRTTIVETS